MEEVRRVLKKIYTELVAIRKELQAIRNDLERVQSFGISNSDCNNLVIKDIQDSEIKCGFSCL